jgi:hypothetical protein
MSIDPSRWAKSLMVSTRAIKSLFIKLSCSEKVTPFIQKIALPFDFCKGIRLLAKAKVTTIGRGDGIWS